VSSFVTRQNVGSSGLLSSIHTTTTSNGDTVQTVHLNNAGWISILLAIIIVPLAGSAISLVVADNYLGRTPGVGVALRTAAGRLLPVLAASLVVHLLEGFGFILLVLPGLLAMALSVSVVPAIVIEHLGPVRGIRRSWGLNRRRLWGILGIALLTGLVFTVCASIVAVPLDLAGNALGRQGGWVLLFLGSVVGSVFSVALSAIVATLVYFDGRIRNEGFDLELTVRRLRQ
jgi:hypothetical protein